MIDLELALTDLANHLDHPSPEHQADALRRRLATTAPGTAHRRRIRSALAVAAAFALVATGVIAIAPARHAVANWLGIGAVEVRGSDRPAPSVGSGARPVPGAPGPTRSAGGADQLAAARTIARFAIATPRLRSTGPLGGVEVDRRVPGGLVVLTYPRFTLIEIATDPTQPLPLGKQVGRATSAERLQVNGVEGVWIGGIHQIGYIDRAGRYETDTVRGSGPVLLWARRGVTYRIEGLRTRAEALAVATSIR